VLFFNCIVLSGLLELENVELKTMLYFTISNQSVEKLFHDLKKLIPTLIKCLSLLQKSYLYT